MNEKIKNLDSEFSAEKFEIWVRDVFLTLQNSFSERNCELIMPLETNELFKSIKNKLKNIYQKIK